MNEVLKFCKKYDACKEGKEYAKSFKSLSDAWENCERSDWMIWTLNKLDKWSHEQKVQIAISCAERVLPIFEKKYPKDKRPRKAIQAAKRYLKNPTDKNKKAAAAASYAASYAAADAAADAAYAAAYAADAAADAVAASYAASYAADAAYAAADAAADAASYAADAVAASSYAADAAAERKWQAKEIRKVVSNPFLKKC